MLDFKKIANAKIKGCRLMNGEKLTTGEIINQIITIDEFDFISIRDNKVGVLTFKEYPHSYYLCGALLTKMLIAFVENNNGIYNDELVNALKESNFKIRLSASRTASGKNVTLVDVI